MRPPQAWASTAEPACVSPACFTGTLLRNPVTGTRVHICCHKWCFWCYFKAPAHGDSSLRNVLLSFLPWSLPSLLHSGLLCSRSRGACRACWLLPPKASPGRRMWRVCRKRGQTMFSVRSPRSPESHEWGEIPPQRSPESHERGEIPPQTEETSSRCGAESRRDVPPGGGLPAAPRNK